MMAGITNKERKINTDDLVLVSMVIFTPVIALINMVSVITLYMFSSCLNLKSYLVEAIIIHKKIN